MDRGNVGSERPSRVRSRRKSSNALLPLSLKLVRGTRLKRPPGNERVQPSVTGHSRVAPSKTAFRQKATGLYLRTARRPPTTRALPDTTRWPLKSCVQPHTQGRPSPSARGARTGNDTNFQSTRRCSFPKGRGNCQKGRLVSGTGSRQVARRKPNGKRKFGDERSASGTGSERARRSRGPPQGVGEWQQHVQWDGQEARRQRRGP